MWDYLELEEPSVVKIIVLSHPFIKIIFLLWTLESFVQYAT